VQALGLWSLRHPRAAVALVLAAAAALGAGALRVGTDSGYRAFLGASHPAVRDLDAVAARFGGGVPFAVTFRCDDTTSCRSVFDPAALEMAHALAAALEATPGVRRVDGPATSPLLVAELFDLPRARQLAPGGRAAPDLDELIPRALADPLWVGQIVSPDARAGALVVTLEDSASATAERAVDAALAAIAPFEARGFSFALAGGPVEFVVAGRDLDRQAQRLVPAIVVLVGGVVWLAFRSAPLAGLALAGVGVALLASVGLQGWLGWPRTSFFQVLPPLLLTIGVCYGIHLLAAYAERLAAAGGGEPAAGGGDAARAPALAGAVAAVSRPCLYTALTTAAGFASFHTSGLESLLRFGWIAALGVMASLAVTFTLLPAALVRLPARWITPPRTNALWARAVDRLAEDAARWRGRTLLATAVLAALAAAGLALLRIDASFEEIYGERNPVVRWAREAAAVRSAETLDLALVLPPGVEPAAPEAIAALARLEAIEAPGLGRPLSILAPMRQLHGLFYGGPLVLDGEGVQPERFASLQRMLRAEAPDLFALYVAPAREGEPAALRLGFQAEKLPQDELRGLVARVEGEVAARLPPGASAVVSGPLVVVSRMIDEIRDTQIGSFGSALLLVGALAALCLRSLPLALLALVPTTLPVLLTLGAMGALGVPLDVGTAMVAAVVLGLGVDEALHLLSAYRRLRDGGLGREPAIEAALREVGRPLLTSAVALGLGFLVLVFVPWKSLASFGAVSVVAIAASLLADLLVLPALLLLATPRRASRPR
jgi:predicted RND superfamily exporter protein